MCWVVCTQSTSDCFPVTDHMKICARKIKLPKSFSILVITESTLLEMPPEFNNPQKLITDSAFLFHSSLPCRSHCSQTGKDGNWWKLLGQTNQVLVQGTRNVPASTVASAPGTSTAHPTELRQGCSTQYLMEQRMVRVSGHILLYILTTTNTDFQGCSKAK